MSFDYELDQITHKKAKEITETLMTSNLLTTGKSYSNLVAFLHREINMLLTELKEKKE